MSALKKRKINPFGRDEASIEALAGASVSATATDDASYAQHNPGSLIKLRVWNFTTYSYGEFLLSHALNMIIGPNGSGKSTFVAAVCLGLGGKIDLIKKKSMDDMIKTGESEARLEITIKGHPGQTNFVVERRFARKLTKSYWKINGAPSDIVRVRALVSGFNIQLDNLCHFLPQDRVAEFASLSPEKLLMETERTIGDNTLLEKHKQLITLDDSWVSLVADVEMLEELVKTITAEVEKFELEAKKFQEFEDKARQIDHHKKALPYAKLQDLKEKLKHLRSEREKAKKALDEFDGNTKPLKDLISGVGKELISAASAHDGIKHRIQELTKKVDRQGKEMDDVNQSISALQNEIESLKSRTDTQKRELELSMKEKEDLLRRLQAAEHVDMSQMPELTARRQEKHEEKSQIEEDLDTIKMRHTRLKRDLNRKENSYREERKKLESNDRLEILRSRNGRFRRDLMENAYEAHSLLRKQRTPDMKYFEAPMVCCRVTDRRYAKYFEKMIDNNSLFAFFFEDEGQYKAISKILPRHLNVPMRVAGRNTIPQPILLEELRQMGFDGYLSEFITGPETVVRGLNSRSYLNCIPVALNPISPGVQKMLLAPTNSGKPVFNRFIVGDELFIINQSKYGSRQVFYKTEKIPAALLMGEEGLSEEVRREIQKGLEQEKNSIMEMQDQSAPLESEMAALQDTLNKAEDELKQLDDEVKALRKRQEVKLKLEAKVTHLEERIQQLVRRTTQDHSEQIRAKESEVLRYCISYGEAVRAVADTNAELVAESVELKKAELLKQQLENKILCYNDLMKELLHRHAELKEIYKNAKARCDEYKRGDAAEEIRQQKLSPEDRESVKKLVEKYLAEEQLSELVLVRKIQQLEDDLSVLANVDRGSLELLKAKRRDLKAAEIRLPQLIEQRNSTKAKIDEIFAPWESELSAMVQKISNAFQKRFITVASDGQVQLSKQERFKDWSLQILVKFRESAELKVLNNQSQSGGERAVSTIFFIMSLQGLTRAPIRIVDEINQGMDPKNEKMAHKYFVKSACKKGQSQYFLVTPKLLPNLYYNEESMAIHCIFAGLHLEPNNPKMSGKGFLDFRRVGQT
ncbi:Chromosome segregation ATPase [Metschnikowia aff. pulcherrima]|uniref:Structural maintenance of chromosomes protein 5 n=1 Tax=Metschnikowia aff. pulcherrima TaxID=2163413 RepID=A0A4P6XMS8_9ASCO|nr:Chromosome segregation ATPase [Metschnikowia aff. pulcherrima]